MSGFSALDSLGGNFRVISNAELASLGNYTSLRHINGDFIIGESNRVNPSLKDVGSFPLLTTLGGNFRIIDNDDLEVINGFPSLDSLGGNFRIIDNSELVDLGDYSSLRHINGSFTVGDVPTRGNTSLVDLGDFSSLMSIGRNYEIYSNNMLVHGGKFPVLDNIRGYFFIRSNAKLKSVGSYPNLTNIGGYLSIRSNDSLRSLYDFPSLTSIGMDDGVWVPSSNSGNGSPLDNVSIVVEDNSSLSDCYTLTEFLSDGMHAVSGGIYINNNAGVCANQSALSNTIYRGDITVTTQAEVNACATP